MWELSVSLGVGPEVSESPHQTQCFCLLPVEQDAALRHYFRALHTTMYLPCPHHDENGLSL